MNGQKLLEGERYVTSSLIPYVITQIRKGLLDITANNTLNVGARDQATLMLENFNSHWGSGAEGTIYQEHETEGDRRRQKGIPRLILFACALDPRTKALHCLSLVDRNIIFKELENYMLQLEGLNDPLNMMGGQQALQDGALAANNTAAIDEDDDDKNYGYFFTSVRAENNNPPNHNADDEDNNDGLAQGLQQHHVFDRNGAIKRELEQWKDEEVLQRIIQLQDGTKKLSDPLKWWNMKTTKYHYMSQVAQRLLCIPATSASAERAFSSAGLTIAADRCSMLPELANELVFLHDAYRLFDEINQNV
jgi:hypothetical protein